MLMHILHLDCHKYVYKHSILLQLLQALLWQYLLPTIIQTAN